MKYPTLATVETASHEALARWHRFLPSPGSDAVGLGNQAWFAYMTQESRVLRRIEERLAECGGMTPELSKWIGLDP